MSSRLLLPNQWNDCAYTMLHRILELLLSPRLNQSIQMPNRYLRSKLGHLHCLRCWSILLARSRQLQWRNLRRLRFCWWIPLQKRCLVTSTLSCWNLVHLTRLSDFLQLQWPSDLRLHFSSRRFGCCLSSRNICLRVLQRGLHHLLLR